MHDLTGWLVLATLAIGAWIIVRRAKKARPSNGPTIIVGAPPPPSQGNGGATPSPAPTPTSSKKLPVWAWILGGAVIAGILAWFFWGETPSEEVASTTWWGSVGGIVLLVTIGVIVTRSWAAATGKKGLAGALFFPTVVAWILGAGILIILLAFGLQDGVQKIGEVAEEGVGVLAPPPPTPEEIKAAKEEAAGVERRIVLASPRTVPVGGDAVRVPDDKEIRWCAPSGTPKFAVWGIESGDATYRWVPAGQIQQGAQWVGFWSSTDAATEVSVVVRPKGSDYRCEVLR